MEYDKKIHIAQQIENFLNGFATGDAGSLERTLSNVKEIINSSELNNKISIASKTKQAEIDKLWSNACNAIKTACESNKKGEMFIDIVEIQKDLQQALNELEMNFWETIRGYIVDDLDSL